MDYIIEGGRRLSGEIAVCGAKNCALPLLGASVLTDEQIVLHNCPAIVDVFNMLELLKAMGKSVFWQGDTVTVSGKLSTTTAPQHLARLLRGSALILGGTLAAYGSVNLPLPGGCAIGARPMDIHLKGLESMGAEISCYDNALHCNGVLHSAEYEMRFASVGATENLLCAAVLAKGTTVLSNCATEPEIEALERMLVKMGAKIEGIGTPDVSVTSVKKLHGVEFDIIPDRIVAATYLSAAVAAGGQITVTNCNTNHLHAFLNVLRPHFNVVQYADAVTVTCERQPLGYGRICTAPYPFFPTDMQSLLLAMASFSNGGQTVVQENLFENRLEHIASELVKLGGNITVKGNSATVTGSKLTASNVVARDLRGGAALAVAGLNADGKTVVHGAENICRGYMDLDICLNVLGAKIHKL